MLRGHGGIAVLWHGGIAVLCGGARSSMPRGIAVVCAVQVFRACVLEVYPLSNSSLRARRRLPWILSKCGVSLGKSTYIYIYMRIYTYIYIYIQYPWRSGWRSIPGLNAGAAVRLGRDGQLASLETRHDVAVRWRGRVSVGDQTTPPPLSWEYIYTSPRSRCVRQVIPEPYPAYSRYGLSGGCVHRVFGLPCGRKHPFFGGGFPAGRVPGYLAV